MYDPDRRVHFPAGVEESAAAVVDNGRGAWSIWLSPDMAVVELAHLMAGLADVGYKLSAEHMGAGVFALLPLEPATPAPYAEDLARIMMTSRDRLPTLIARA